MFETIIIIALLAYLVARDVIWYRKEMYLVDHAIPRNQSEMNDKNVRDIVLEIVENQKKSRKRNKKIIVQEPQQEEPGAF